MDIYLLRMRLVLQELGRMRKDDKLSNESTREIVINISDNLTDEFGDSYLLKKFDEKLSTKVSSKIVCNVCGLNYDILRIKDEIKCSHCKLYHLAWNIKK